MAVKRKLAEDDLSPIGRKEGAQRRGPGTLFLCFYAGANSIFYGERLLTTGNPEEAEDRVLLAKLGLGAELSKPC